MDELFIQSMSLLLQQVRVARRALEDVERHTARYGGLSFAAAFAAGPRFGEPPMFNGALRVHVININDLAPGDGLAGMFQALLGGVGRFIGGVGGGFVGGLVAGWKLPDMIASIDRIAASVDRIVANLGIKLKPDEDKDKKDNNKDKDGNKAEAQAKTGENLSATLDRVVAAIKSLTALFQAATDPKEAEGTDPIDRTERGAAWLAIITAVERALTSLGRVIDGLTPLIVVAVGSIYLLIDKLRDIRMAILETITFIVRNVFLLRGLVLVIVYETLASVLNLGAKLLGHLSNAVTEILKAVFHAIEELVKAAVAAIRLITAGLANTINGVLEWVVKGLGEALRWLGSLHVFRVVTHALLILPSLLPPIYMLKTGKEMPDAQKGQLSTAHGWGNDLKALLSAGDPSASVNPTFTKFPDLGDLLVPKATVDGLVEQVKAAETGLNTALTEIFKAGGTFLTNTASVFQNQGAIEAAFSNSRINDQLKTLDQRATALTAAIVASQQAAEAKSSSGLEAVAQAYEAWLTGKGLETMLTRFQQHFADTKAGTAAGAGTAAAVTAPTPDPPAATVEIERVEILVEPPADAGAGQAAPLGLAPVAPPLSDADIYFAVIRFGRELARRGSVPGDDPYDFDPSPPRLA